MCVKTRRLLVFFLIGNARRVFSLRLNATDAQTARFIAQTARFIAHTARFIAQQLNVVNRAYFQFVHGLFYKKIYQPKFLQQFRADNLY